MNARDEPADLAMPGPPVLATGAWFASTAARVTDGHLRRATCVGNLIDADACRRFDAALEALLSVSGETPRAVAHDLHPDFHSTRVALALGERLGISAIPVQHHHAHLAAVLAEHGHQGAVVGLAADGVGLGTDGTPWGGELLQLEGCDCERIGHLRPLPMPGGDRAALEPWRMAAAVMHLAGRGEEIAARFAHRDSADQLASVLERPRLSPPTTSLGRHFDAAAALLGLCDDNHHEAAAPVALEAAASAHGPVEPEPRLWRFTPDGTLDLLPLLTSLIDEKEPARGAARFHATLVCALTEWLANAARLHDVDTVVLGGGCLHNHLLSEGLVRQLAATGLRVLHPVRLSPGDADLCVGQAWVAQRKLEGI